MFSNLIQPNRMWQIANTVTFVEHLGHRNVRLDIVFGLFLDDVRDLLK